jgi:uridine monophosphate synthetase
MKGFFTKLDAAIDRNGSLLCIGLDPREDRLPPGTDMKARLTDWGKSIIDQTADQVCCYKPNFAFYEQAGVAGLQALQDTIRYVPEDIPVLLDVKRGDIGSTASAYAAAAYDIWGADAVTLNPYMGEDGVRPFLETAGKAVFLLCYTSNPSAGQIQEHGIPPLFEHIAHQVCKWGNEEQIGIVVGATQPEALRRVRQICQHYWILSPGVGAQGGRLADVLRAGLRDDGKGLIIPVSRGVIFEADVRQAASELREQIQAEVAGIKPEPRDTTRLELAKALFQAGCVQFGNFTLASGIQSPIYVDLRRAVSYPDLFKLMARAYMDVLAGLHFDHIASVPYAALPLGAVVASGLMASLIYPRKEAKDHGTTRKVEGSYLPGECAVLLEDVVTSGGSVVSAAETLREAGLTVSDAVVLVDRQQGGGALLEAAGLRLHLVMGINDLLDEIRTEALIDQATFVEVKEYLDGSRAN